MVAYALRTRAPLSAAPKGRLPFDLHVLGLPLAFILSQDQTLHCIIVVLFLFPVLGLRYDSLFLTGGPRLLGGPARLLASYAGLKLSKNSRPPFSLPLFRVVENGCKGTTFFHSSKPFFTFFSKNFLNLDYQSLRNTKKRDPPKQVPSFRLLFSNLFSSHVNDRCLWSILHD